MIILYGFSIFFCELEVNFVGEQEFNEEIYNLWIFLIFEEVI